MDENLLYEEIETPIGKISITAVGIGCTVKYEVYINHEFECDILVDSNGAAMALSRAEMRVEEYIVKKYLEFKLFVDTNIGKYD